MDRGCSAPGCDMPGYLCEVHHVEEWAECYRTDIDNPTFACGPHPRLLKPGGWTTRKRADGRTEWIPHPTPRQPGATPTTANPAPSPSTTPKTSHGQRG